MKIEETLFEGNEFLRELFNSIPTPCIVVDDDVRIFFYNAAASKIIGRDENLVYMKRGGEALHCISSTEMSDGCGHAPACKECVVRNSAARAIQGDKTFRSVTRMKLVGKDDVTEIHLMVSVSPLLYDGRSLAVLFLEDISEIIQLRDMMPICSRCKKIRTDDYYWENIKDTANGLTKLLEDKRFKDWDFRYQSSW